MTKITREIVEQGIDASIGAAPAPTVEQVTEFAQSTIPYHFAAIAIEPFYVPYVAPMYHAAGKKLCALCNYPLGGMTFEDKYAQAKQAIADGADELDCGIDISAFMSGNYKKVEEDFKPMLELADGRIIKWLYFCSLMTEDQQLKCVEIAVKLGVPFLKTNPGYGFSTTLDNVRLVKKNFGDAIKIMTSGGVRTTEDAIAMMEAGASRIATSSAFKIMEGFDQ
ncbi:deoxyribose-phosphate aldolase [Christensenella intestinihominis]|uniref:deoxyribose-phosphate aldolase n=1 Tax=Christensenella intestinihominis TaxID=1851429 RepID=UPI00082ECF14|nr:deoxyribose-phosphate aldolase [Christensenella intestinihominis]